MVHQRNKVLSHRPLGYDPCCALILDAIVFTTLLAHDISECRERARLTVYVGMYTLVLFTTKTSTVEYTTIPLILGPPNQQ